VPIGNGGDALTRDEEDVPLNKQARGEEEGVAFAAKDAPV
jgi:hypothetical protein